MKFRVDNTEACDPINTLLTVLQDKGFIIEENRVSDYHFNELYFRMRNGGKDFMQVSVNIDKICRQSPVMFYCECHWSMVELWSA